MKVCITEKPSVARDIAAILGATTRRNGYFEGTDVCVTWTFGHLCCLKEPQDYEERWKHWSIGALPMIPPRFGIKLIKDKGIEKQFKVIKSLIEKADEVINCGDAGQEGELIQRWVMQKAGIKCPVKRLWISSLTDEAIRQGFNDLRPESEYKNLYEAGLSRAIGDWLLGLNSTRLYTLKYGGSGSILSVGRVQTPTLSLIVERQRQISQFVPEDYWELKTTYRETVFSARNGKYTSQDAAKAAVDQIKREPFTVTDVTQKGGRESAPRLFDLTSLQVECNRLWGWSADQTLKHIQSLYEKKVTSYPRVDTTYLPDDIYPKVPDILRKMTPYANLTAAILSSQLPKSKKVFDNSKVTDHHAIIPTGESPSVLVGDERKLYHLIARRFIAAFYPDCEFNTTTVTGTAEKIEFRATGKIITNPGWRTVYAGDADSNQLEQDKDEPENGILPTFTAGESGAHKPRLAKKTTQPPKPYTEGTLLRAMEGAGKTVDDEDLREALKENGIGRPSTRSAIIETLFKRRYIKRERKNLIPTQAGMDLIDTIQIDLLKSARLTGIWENKLRRIERGTYSATEFIDDIKELLNQIVTAVLADRSNQRITAVEPPKSSGKGSAKSSTKRTIARRKEKTPKDFADIVCPKCKKGRLVKGRTAVGCNAFREGCDFVIPFAALAPDVAADAITVGHVVNFLKKKR